jgi:hypothetical protein
VVDENSVVDRNSIKLVDESSVVVENTGLKLEEVDEKTVVYQSVFSPKHDYYDNFSEDYFEVHNISVAQNLTILETIMRFC